MNLSQLLIIVQIVSGIWAVFSGIVTLGPIRNVLRRFINWLPSQPFLIISMVLAIAVLVLSGIIFLILLLHTTGSVTPTLDPTTAVIDLMDQEVTAAENRDLLSIDRIYAPGAMVTDAACQPGEQFRTWNGREEIKSRYHDLPQFLSLAHIKIQVTLIPNDSSAVMATATASTQGEFVMVAPDGSQKQIALGGNEQWEFSKIGDQWFITKFTYSLCQSAKVSRRSLL